MRRPAPRWRQPLPCPLFVILCPPMSRRSKPSRWRVLIGVFDLIALLAWWLSIAAAIVGFGWLRHMAQSQVASPHPGLQELLLGALVQGGQYAVAVLFLAAGGISYMARAHRKQLLINTRTRDRLAAISWQDFELLVGEAYRRKGFAVQELGGEGPDGGIDLVLRRDGEKVFVQCKHWKATSVGVDVVRQIFGVMAAHGATGCVVVTSGSYTSAALDFARGRNVDLIDGPKLLKMMEQSDSAAAGGIHIPPSGEPHAAPGLNKTIHPPAQPPALRSTPQLTPRCPLCQSPMTKRTARKGSNAGQEFWGCTRYPDCRGTR